MESIMSTTLYASAQVEQSKKQLRRKAILHHPKRRPEDHDQKYSVGWQGRNAVPSGFFDEYTPLVAPDLSGINKSLGEIQKPVASSSLSTFAPRGPLIQSRTSYETKGSGNNRDSNKSKNSTGRNFAGRTTLSNPSSDSSSEYNYGKFRPKERRGNQVFMESTPPSFEGAIRDRASPPVYTRENHSRRNNDLTPTPSPSPTYSRRR